MKLKLGGRVHNVVRRSPKAWEVDGAAVEIGVSEGAGDGAFTKAGAPVRVFAVRAGDRVFAHVDGRDYVLSVVSRASGTSAGHGIMDGGLEAPMPGRVTRVPVKVGDPVVKGQELLVVEAMKMENAITAPRDGVVRSLSAKVGDMVIPGVSLVELS